MLAGKNGTWLLADRENGTVFTTEVPSDLTDESGKKISAEILKAGDYVDVYGDGIMLESYPGQYPGVNKMVVTGKGTTDELKQYQDVIDMVLQNRIPVRRDSRGCLCIFPWTDNGIDDRSDELYMESAFRWFGR